MSLQPTPSQTVGPYFSLGLDALNDNHAAGPAAEGERVVIAGRILDGDGRPVPDAIVETWQADARGHYLEPDQAPAAAGFRGFARMPTDASGAFELHTVKPGAVPGPGSDLQAPHIVFMIGMRGLLKHLVTRLYFPDEPGNDTDPILALVPPARRATLVANAAAGGRPGALSWEVRLQGPNETVFFDY